MKMNRRDFLKGLMVLAGAAAVEVSGVEWRVADEALPEIEEPLPNVRPRGRLGSLRIGDQWYALHDAEIVIERFDTQAIYVPDAAPGQFRPIAHMGGFIKEWRIEAELDWDAPVDLSVRASREFEIDARRSFLGSGHISVAEHWLFLIGSDQLSRQHLTIVGFDALRQL